MIWQKKVLVINRWKYFLQTDIKKGGHKKWQQQTQMKTN